MLINCFLLCAVILHLDKDVWLAESHLVQPFSSVQHASQGMKVFHLAITTPHLDIQRQTLINDQDWIVRHSS